MLLSLVGEGNGAVTPVTDVTLAAAPAVTTQQDGERLLITIYHAEYQSLVRLAALLTGDRGSAEDVVQDCFVAMHGAWPRLRDNDKAVAYLRRSVVNRARSVLRHRMVVDKHPPKPPPDEPSAEHGALNELERAAVITALRKLPGRQREAVALRFYLDLPEREVARAMGISQGAVKSHMARAMASLRSTLLAEA
jgi:RNA polymerase sigma-70 factor (sigma-E family)